MRPLRSGHSGQVRNLARRCVATPLAPQSSPADGFRSAERLVCDAMRTVMGCRFENMPAHLPQSGYRQFPMIVCVDDDHALLALYLQTFFRNGYRCIPCASTAAAFAAVRSLPVVMAVVDFELPEQNGAQLARALRAIRPALPILLVSGSTSLTEEDLRLFDGVCNKGRSASALFGKIADLLNRRGTVPS